MSILAFLLALYAAIAGVTGLAPDTYVQAAAQTRAEQMAASTSMYHDPYTAALLLEQAGDDFTTGWELIAAVWPTTDTGYLAQRLLAAWEGSPSHYRGLYDGAMRCVGLGAAWGADGRVYVEFLSVDGECEE